MKNLSLKLDDRLFEETELLLVTMNDNRNRYINKAIEAFNKINKRNILAKQLEIESELVGTESMKVLAEFEILDDDATAI